MVQAAEAVRRASSDGSRATDVVGDDVPEPASMPVLQLLSETRLRTTGITREAEISDIAQLAPPLLRVLGPIEATSPRPAAMTQTQHFVAALFGAVAGYVDTIGFLALFGIFTAHVTGDLVAEVAELSNGSIVTRVTMLPIFMVSVAVATVLARATRRDGHAALFPLLALMTAALAVFGAAGVLLRPFMTSSANWAVGFVSATGVAAMAIQNMIMRDALNSWTPTTIMTGNLTQVTIQLVELVVAAREPDPQERARIRNDAKLRLMKFGLPLTGFVLGALLSAFLTRRYGFWSVGVPTAVVAALTGWHWRQARRRG